MIHWRNYVIPSFNTYVYKRQIYLDCILSLDTEVTTFFFVNREWVAQDMSRLDHEYFEQLSNAPKLAVPYIWQMGINDDIIYGREISEFFEFWERFKIVNYKGIAIVYVHNLGYDFEFICEDLPPDTRVFAKAPFKPMKVDISSMGLCFRCSYMLTNMSLENCAKEFRLDVEKTTELDYSVARLPVTPLSNSELHYCENDVKIINAMIKKVFLERYENVADIPLTQTGEVRREIKKIAHQIPYHMHTLNKIKPEIEDYRIITRVIAGGYTHLNGLYNGMVVKDVDSYDKRSSYPDIMCTRKFPSEKWHKCNSIRDTEKYAYMINVRFTGIECQYAWAYISAHKVKSRGARCDNGKIFSAKWVEMWCTEIDYLLIKRCYRIEEEEILCVYRSYKKYLPREIILYILKLFGEKTSLKGLEEFMSLYLRSKQLVNAVFGLSLTNTIVPDIVFNALSHLWDIPEPLTDLQISDKLGKQRPFLNFSWGAWVTAYGRYDIFNVLLDINIDAVYSDTDSAKIVNGEKYASVFADYNKKCERRIDEVCKALNIDKALFFPKNSKGEMQPLGFFEYEGRYEKFKSIGSKKYCFVKDGKFQFVVAGLKKTYLHNNQKIPTMTSMKQMFDGSIIPHGRSVHWHLTDMPEVELMDYMGNKWVNTRRQGIAFLSACYTFNITGEYKGFILNIRNKYTNYFRGGYNE